MPGNNGVWFNDDKRIHPSRPKPVKQDPKQPIAALEPRAGVFSIEHTQLLPQSENLETEIVARTKKRTEKESRIDIAS